MNVSLVYNNDKLIGKCSKYAIEKVQGTSPFVMLENFEPKQPQLNENQQIAINNAKKSFEKGADLYDCAIDMMLYDGLTDKEWAKVTVAFLLWVQEQEEE
ncbi:hypothetical protein ACT2B6_11065 [Candidatus Enterococcus leclercqii]